MTEIQEEIPVEYANLVLEDQLVDHLATPEGARAIWQERLTPECLPPSETGPRDVLRFVLDHMDRYREPPDVSVISEEVGLSDFNVPIAPVEYVIAKLRERYQRRQLNEITVRVGMLAAEPAGALNYGIDELQRLRMETTSKKGDVSSADLFATIDDYQKRHGEKLTGVTFGFPEFDEHFGGLKTGELTVLLARPKRFKSWMLLKSAADALAQEKDVAFATMELSEVEMRNRFHCMMAGVSWPKFTHGHLRQEDLVALDRVAHELHDYPHKAHFFRPKKGERTVSYLTAYALEKDAKALYVDQLSWFDGARDENAWQKIGVIMEDLKDAAQHFPVYMAAQYNREAQATDGIADLAKIGLADAIGQTADNLLGIYASEDMMKSTPQIFHLGVIEARSYEGNTWEMQVRLNEETNFKCLGELST